MWWSGFKGKFYGVTWNGADSQISSSIAGNVTLDYQINIVHALSAAPAFATFINGLNGSVTIQAHSLGNLLVGAAYKWGINPTNYFMNDAAVAKEAYDPTESQIGNDPTALDVRAGDNVSVDMRSPDWITYPSFYYASNWYSLFPSGDDRSQLTWKGYLADVLNSSGHVYNFYSSGEDVLANRSGAPPDLFTLAQTMGAYVWNAQERYKGQISPAFLSRLSDIEINSTTGNILSSSYGGWGFNLGDNTPRTTNDPLYPSYYTTTSNILSTYRIPLTAANLQATLSSSLSSQLQQWPFFYPGYDPNPTLNLESPSNDYTSSIAGPTWTQALFNATTGSSTARNNESTILARMIPVESVAAGANAFKATALSLSLQYDMNNMKPNGWTPERPLTDQYWHHSDMKTVSYFYTYQLYDTFNAKIYHPTNNP